MHDTGGNACRTIEAARPGPTSNSPPGDNREQSLPLSMPQATAGAPERVRNRMGGSEEVQEPSTFVQQLGAACLTHHVTRFTDALCADHARGEETSTTDGGSVLDLLEGTEAYTVRIASCTTSCPSPRETLTSAERCLRCFWRSYSCPTTRRSTRPQQRTASLHPSGPRCSSAKIST
jgi:hypothetical protein